jgi:hypothetical protein
LTLGYTLPKSISQKIRTENFRVYVSGRNLWTWSKIDDYDPERGGAISNPMNKVIVGGINLDF